MGEIYYAEGQADSAKTIYFRVIDEFGKLKHGQRTKRHLELESNCYNLLAGVFNRNSNFSKAIEYNDKSLSLCENLENTEGIISNLNDLMGLSLALSEDSLMHVYFQKARRIHTKIKDSLFLAYNWETIGMYYRGNLRSIDSSIQAYRKALGILERLHKEEFAARLLFRLGSIYRLKDDTEASANCLYKALDIEEKQNNIYGIINAQLALANLFTRAGDFSRSMEWLDAALKLCVENKFVNKQANILMQMGINFQQQNMLNEARRHFEQSLSLVNEYGLGPAPKSALYMQMGIVAKKEGDINLALSYALKGLQLKQYGNQTLIFQNLQISLLYLQLGNYDQAEQYALTGLAMGRQLGLQKEVQEICFQLHNIYEETSNYERALFYFKKSTGIQDSLDNIKSNEILIKKDAEYQILKKEQELALEKQTKALLELEKETQKYMIVGLSLMLLTGLLAFFVFYQRKRLTALHANNRIMVQLNEIEGLKLRLHNVLLEGKSHSNGVTSINDYLDEALSHRELEVLEELMKGKSNKDISETLCISVNTVTTHLKKIYAKLEVGNRTQAVKKASAIGLHQV